MCYKDLGGYDYITEVSEGYYNNIIISKILNLSERISSIESGSWVIFSRKKLFKMNFLYTCCPGGGTI